MSKKPKLNEIIAIATGRKAQVQKNVTELYHKLQKTDLFDGFRRTYKPRSENGDPRPSESKNPQFSVNNIIKDARNQWQDLFNVVLTLDNGNCHAKADIEVDGKTVAENVPATTLLFLEKQLSDVKSFISRLPTPDPAEQWTFDGNQNCLATVPTQKVSTSKVQRPIVLYDATPEHPAQTQLITEDVPVGDWTAILYTTRIPAFKKEEALQRVEKLLDAVKVARERANSTDVEKYEMSGVMDFIFGGIVDNARES